MVKGEVGRGGGEGEGWKKWRGTPKEEGKAKKPSTHNRDERGGECGWKSDGEEGNQGP